MTTALVLGAAVRPDGTPSASLRLRVSHAVALYRSGKVSAICVSGGQGRHGAPEGAVGTALAREMGVPAAALIAECAARNTVENLVLSTQLIPDGPIVVVSNRWHVPRALLAARILGIAARGSGPVGRLSWPGTLKAVLREVAAVPSTSLRAWRARREV